MRKSIKIFSLLVIVMVVIATLFGCKKNESTSSTNDDSWNVVSEKKVLTVGVSSTNLPMTQLEEEEYVGFDIEIAKEVASRLNLDIHFVDIDSADMALNLENGSIDCYWSGLPLTTDISEFFTLSQPYANTQYLLVTQQNSDIRNLGLLTGRRVGVVKNSLGEKNILSAQTLVSSLEELKQYDNTSKMEGDLEATSIDVAVMNDLAYKYYIKHYQELKTLKSDGINDEVLGGESYVIAYKRGNESLKNMIDKTINGIIRDGYFELVSNLWFDTDITIKNE